VVSISSREKNGAEISSKSARAEISSKSMRVGSLLLSARCSHVKRLSF
jgi:hypothetical protein